MQSSKLLKLLSALNTEEFKRFGRFIRSPYYSYNPMIWNLYKYIANYYPTLDSPKLERTIVFAKLFPDTSFNWSKLKKLMSVLTQLTEEYLIHLELDKNPFQKKKYLIQAIGQRDLYDFFERGTHQLLQELESQNQFGIDYFKDRVELLAGKYFNPNFKRYSKKDSTIEELMDSLDSYFGLAKIRYGTELNSRQRIFQQSIAQRFLEGIASEAKQGLLSGNPTFLLYVQLQNTLEQLDDQTFLVFEKTVKEKINELMRTDQQIIFFNGLNYISRKINQGNPIFSSKALEWYKLGLEMNLLIEKATISETTFGNIVVTGCREQQYEWVANFMEIYQHFLKEAIREDVYAFNQAVFHFYQGDFDQVLLFLNSYSFAPIYQPKVRLMEIRAIFELFLIDHNYFELLISKVYASKYYIQRNKLLTAHSLKPYYNCIQLIEKLANKILKKEKKIAIQAWIIKNTENRRVSTKAWLLEKVERL